MKTNRSALTVDDVLYEFAITQERPDADLLERFVRRYPEYAEALTSFAVSLALDTLVGPENQPAELSKEANDGISRAMSRFQNRLHAVKTRTQDKSAVSIPQNPFAVLTREEVKNLAQRLHANNLFIMKLRDREIDSETMTSGFKQRVADEIRAPIDLVVAHFSGPAQVHRRAQFKAESKPEVGAKQTFGDAVRNCGLTPEQQAYLFAL